MPEAGDGKYGICSNRFAGALTLLTDHANFNEGGQDVRSRGSVPKVYSMKLLAPSPSASAAGTASGGGRSGFCYSSTLGNIQHQGFGHIEIHRCGGGFFLNIASIFNAAEELHIA